ncbi:MAG: DNA-directed RNA polymerase subunit D [Thermoplasmata archaeon]
MKVEFRGLEEDRALILIEDADPAFVNALRRTLLTDVPKMAIEDVEFHLGPIRGEDGEEYESVTPLFDEIIAHRLGLVPIPTDLELFVPRDRCESCEGEGCTNCTIMYSLNQKGPGTVFSRDLKPIGDPHFEPVDPDIPIVKLGEGQAVLIYSTAILGTGHQHTKWQAAHAVAYKYYPILEFDPKDKALDESVAKVCPVNILEAGDGGFRVTDIEKCTLCKLCEEKSEGRIKVKGDPTRFLFHFETDGSLTALDVLLKGLEILQEKFAGVAENVGALT